MSDPGKTYNDGFKPEQIFSETDCLSQEQLTKYSDGTLNPEEKKVVETHLIDREGAWRGNFHGLRFDPTNLVLYINGLANDVHKPGERKNQGLWSKIRALF